MAGMSIPLGSCRPECVLTLNSKCVTYSGPNIVQFGILKGVNLDSVISDITNYILAIPPPPPGIWGTITGTLSNQTDLQNALNAKSDANNVVNTFNGRNGTVTLTSGDVTTALGFTPQQVLSGTGIVKSTAGTISYINGTSSQFVKADGSLDSSTYITGNQTITLSGEASGSGATSIAVTLSNAAVIAKVLTGYTSGAGTISATDSLLSAIQKLNGNIGALVTGVSSVTNSDGTLTISPTTGAVIASLALTHANTWTGKQTFNPSVTASGALANGTIFTPALTAVANNDILVANDITPTFSTGVLTGVFKIGERISYTALAATTADAIFVRNTTAAVNGTQQNSPSITQEGLGFGTTAGTSQSVKFSNWVVPAQSTVPTGTWTLASSVAGSALTGRLFIASNGLPVGTTSQGLFITDAITQGGISFATQAPAIGRMRTIPGWIFEELSGVGANNTCWTWIYPSSTAGGGAVIMHNFATTAGVGFAPTGGTATYTTLQIADVINQTGGANGITYGLRENATITAAFDYRAIEVNHGRTVLNNGVVHKRTTVADIPYAVLLTDYIVAYTTLTTTRAVTLPTAAPIVAGQTFIIKDEAGTAGTNNITFVGTIDGSATAKINTNFGIMRVYWNGTNYSTF